MYIGDDELGRNDPCYCGSNKKYKYCHGILDTELYPKQFFFTEILNMKTPNFVNSASEHIQVMRVDVTFTSPLPWDSEVITMLTPLIEETWNVKDLWEGLIKQRKNKLTHKLKILRYHMESFKQLELHEESMYRKGVPGNTTLNRIQENPILIASVESFLFQAKSTLDVFAQLIGHTFKFSINTYKDDGQKLIDILSSEHYNKYRADADALISLLTVSKIWVEKLVKMRDEVTHYSDLNGLSCFMFKYINSNDCKVTVFYPSLSDGERISTYMDSTWNEITSLISNSLPILVKVVKARRQFSKPSRGNV